MIDWKKMTNAEKIAACSKYEEHLIKGFFGEYRWLSNFHKCEIIYKDRMFGSTEAAYMSEKHDEPLVKDKFAGLELEPRDAKKMGRILPLKANWDEIKIQVMYDVNLIKFSTHSDLKEKLMATDGKYLEEANWWKDRFWGTCEGTGENNLGKVLMEVRDELFARKLGL